MRGESTGRVFYAKTDSGLSDASLRALRSAPLDVLGLTETHLKRACTLALGSAPLSVTPLSSQGTFHRLFRVDGASGGRYVLRASALGSEGTDGALEIEAQVARTAAARGVPVAEALYVDCSRQHCPFDFALMRWVAGNDLGSYDHDDAALAPLLQELGRVVGALHGAELSGYGGVTLGPNGPAGELDRWSEYVWTQLEAHLQTCVDLGSLPPSAAARVLELGERSRDALDACVPALLHGDLGNHNVMSDGERILALLDWEDARAGDPIYDVAFWATFHPARRHAAFLEGYREVRELPPDFDFRFWFYFLRVALAKTVHRHRFGYVDRPGREPAARRIELALQRLVEVAGR